MSYKNLKILIFLLFSIFLKNSCFSNSNDSLISKRIVKKLKINSNILSVIYFLEPSCPISQKYQSIIGTLIKEYNNSEINSIFIFPNNFSTKSLINKFADEIDLKSKIIFDKKKYYTTKIGGTVTPEVFLVAKTGQIIYHGAIDDWFYALGKNRNFASNLYLKNAINNYLNKQPIIPKKTEAIGCVIEI